jgi:hypothetical protein
MDYIDIVKNTFVICFAMQAILILIPLIQNWSEASLEKYLDDKRNHRTKITSESVV